MQQPCCIQGQRSSFCQIYVAIYRSYRLLVFKCLKNAYMGRVSHTALKV